jgi:hypothetical protein
MFSNFHTKEEGRQDYGEPDDPAPPPLVLLVCGLDLDGGRGRRRRLDHAHEAVALELRQVEADHALRRLPAAWERPDHLNELADRGTVRAGLVERVEHRLALAPLAFLRRFVGTEVTLRRARRLGFSF